MQCELQSSMRKNDVIWYAWIMLLGNLHAYNVYDRYDSHQSRCCGPMMRDKCKCMVYMHVYFVNDNDYMVHYVNCFGNDW